MKQFNNWMPIAIVQVNVKNSGEGRREVENRNIALYHAWTQAGPGRNEQSLTSVFPGAAVPIDAVDSADFRRVAADGGTSAVSDDRASGWHDVAPLN